MPTRDHLLAVVEPNPPGEVSLDVATDHVARGGTATILVLVDDRTRDDIRRFADSEDLHPINGEAVALDRLADAYAARVGGDGADTVIADSTSSARELLDVAAEANATSVVIPQHVAARRSLRRLAADTTLPVLIAPAA